jgi:hypothetical protein
MDELCRRSVAWWKPRLTPPVMFPAFRQIDEGAHSYCTRFGSAHQQRPLFAIHIDFPFRFADLHINQMSHAKNARVRRNRCLSSTTVHCATRHEVEIATRHTRADCRSVSMHVVLSNQPRQPWGTGEPDLLRYLPVRKTVV